MERMYDAVLFDLDGTLTDSEEGIVLSARYALNKMGKPCPEENVLRKFLGPPLADSFMRYCGMTEQEAIQATDAYRERYIPLGWKENRVYPGIRALLRELKKQGVYLGVATGKPQTTSEKILRYFGLLPYFDAVAGPDKNDLHADKAALIRRVLPENLRGRALMVGDTVGDLRGARDAGVFSAAALWGYGDNDGLIAEKPDHAAATVAELSRLLIGETPAKGYFITLEGLDGCGKTTQQKLLQNRLIHFGYEPYLTREPGGCPIAEEIRKIVLAQEDGGMCAETEALLFAAARAQHVREVILPQTKKGHVVVSDRFVDSSLVYQGMGRGLDIGWVKEINRAALVYGAPDTTIYLKMNSSDALGRRTAVSRPDRIEQSDAAFFARAENAYDTLAKENPGRFLTVGAQGSVDEVAEEIWRGLFPRLNEAQV